MDVFLNERDAAVEQLYDELVGRTWSVQQVLGAVMPNVDRRDVHEHLAAVANRHVVALATRP